MPFVPLPPAPELAPSTEDPPPPPPAPTPLAAPTVRISRGRAGYGRGRIIVHRQHFVGVHGLECARMVRGSKALGMGLACGRWKTKTNCKRLVWNADGRGKKENDSNASAMW